MESLYQRKYQDTSGNEHKSCIQNYLGPETSLKIQAETVLDNRIEYLLTEKEKLFKDIYPCIKFFDKLIYEARKEVELENKKLR